MLPPRAYKFGGIPHCLLIGIGEQGHRNDQGARERA